MIKVQQGEYTYTVPCGKCAFCLTNKRSQWMFRVFYEMKTQDKPGWFLTMTYNEKYVKRTPAGLSLRFRDVQLFLKKLRKAKHYAKYICVGEYGSETKRPHYHMLLWTDANCVQLQDFWKANNGEVLGTVHFGRLTMQAAMYTLKYIIQPKQKAKNGIEKTRGQFSKGIGLAYLSSNVYDYHTWDYEHPSFLSVVDGRKTALPRYYRYKIFTKYQLKKEGSRIKWETIRARRQKMREYTRQGRQGFTEYYDALRTEQAKRIIQKTKYNETL